MNIDIGIYDATLIPAMIFVLWIIGQAGVPRRFLPLTALVLGVVLGLVFIGTTPEGAIAGVLLAAAAVGFHSGSTNTAQAITGIAQAKANPEELIGEEIEIPGLAGTFEVRSVDDQGVMTVKQVTAGR